MKIKEVEERTGINANTIRYYEEVALVIPKRNEDNDYREYDQKDIDKLLEIKFLRNLQMPIKTIKELLTDSISLNSAITKTLTDLEKQKDKLETSIDLLNVLINEKSTSTEPFTNKVFDYQKPHPIINFIDNIHNQFSRYLPILRFGFLPQEGINSTSDFIFELVTYAKNEDKKLEIIKGSMHPIIRLNDVLMQAVLATTARTWNYKVVKFKILKENIIQEF